MRTAPAPTDAQVLQHTQLWFEGAVLGLNLCPFAHSVHRKGQIEWVVSAARTRQGLAEDLAVHALRLSRANASALDTLVLIHPRVLKPFSAYLAFLPLADEVLRSLKLQGELQIASFHPQYRFAELPAADAAHRSNRSPYPMLHLLREASVARAVASAGDTAAIYQRNIARLRALGDAGWLQALQGGPGESAQHLSSQPTLSKGRR
jgi:uncharacterized protein